MPGPGEDPPLDSRLTARRPGKPLVIPPAAYRIPPQTIQPSPEENKPRIDIKIRTTAGTSLNPGFPTGLPSNRSLNTFSQILGREGRLIGLQVGTDAGSAVPDGPEALRVQVGISDQATGGGLVGDQSYQLVNDWIDGFHVAGGHGSLPLRKEWILWMQLRTSQAGMNVILMATIEPEIAGLGGPGGPVPLERNWVMVPMQPQYGGRKQRIALGTPVAGADYTAQVVPANTLWRFGSATGALTSAVAAANRRPRANIADAAVNVYAKSVSGGLQPASIVVSYNWGIGEEPTYNNNFVHVTADEEDLPLPDLRAPGGHQLLFSTVGLQAADQWGAGSMEVEEWLPSA